MNATLLYCTIAPLHHCTIACKPRMGDLRDLVGDAPKRDTFTTSAAIVMNHFIHCQRNKASVNDPSTNATKPWSSFTECDYSYVTWTEQHVTMQMVHSVIHQFWSGTQCTGIALYEKICAISGQFRSWYSGLNQDRWWLQQQDEMRTRWPLHSPHLDPYGSVGLSGSHATACAEYSGQSDEIPGGRVGRVATKLYSAWYAVYGIDVRQALLQLVDLLVIVVMRTLQRWSEYNTNVLEYEYDYFEHAWVRVRVLRKQMYSSTSTITLQYTRVRVRLLYNISMITLMITLMNILFLT